MMLKKRINFFSHFSWNHQISWNFATDTCKQVLWASLLPIVRTPRPNLVTSSPISLCSDGTVQFYEEVYGKAQTQKRVALNTDIQGSAYI